MEERRTDLEIYIHIPFCARKCEYCDFLSGVADIETKRAYHRALLQEIKNFPRKDQYKVKTVFFGGGTPSILPPGWIGEILDLLYRSFSFAENAEITLECNPGTANEKSLKEYKRMGINRLSLGLQSAENEELKLLGRIHTWEDFCRTYDDARAAGFSNINVDLMSALPGQSPESWEGTLRRVIQLHPEHISAYSLIIEEGTPFYERYHEDDEKRSSGDRPEYLPGEEEERLMYERTEALLKEAGYQRYEISNYSRPGFACCHNIGYWTGVDYIGFGLGASSLQKGVRYQNETSLDAYLAHYLYEKSNKKEINIKQQEEQMVEKEQDSMELRQSQRLTQEDQMEEFMFLGLRMMEGVSEQEFQRRFGCAMDAVYGSVLKNMTEKGLLKRERGRVYLTARGIDVSNVVMAEFLLDNE